jgi:ArsR family metal-binding transcriptional regulator
VKDAGVALHPYINERGRMTEKFLTTFPSADQFRKAEARVRAWALPYEVVSPDPGYALVGVPALVLAPEVSARLSASMPEEFVFSGWVTYRAGELLVPSEPPEAFPGDVFGRASIVVLAPCVADATRIRLTARITGDLRAAFPYLSAEMRQGSYNPDGPTFTFMEGYRMVAVYPQRISVAKADDIVDGWRALEVIRRRVNEVWARRVSITPSYERRQKPPALEIFKRLPGTNCRACGEPTCLAFAVKVHGGDASVRGCSPVFGDLGDPPKVDGEFAHLREALVEICRGLGVED